MDELEMTGSLGMDSNRIRRKVHNEGRRCLAQLGGIPHLWYDESVSKQYYVYIMTNRHNRVLYTGITNNLRRRTYEHRTGQGGGFTSRYRVTKLVYYEMATDVNAAIAREKQIKAGSRQGKIDLIEGMNPGWADLYEDL